MRREDDGSTTLVLLIDKNGNISTSGGIHADGDIETSTNVAAVGSVTGADFIFDPPMLHYHMVPLMCGEMQPVSGVASSWTFFIPFAYWTMPAGGPGLGTDTIIFPLNLPEGAVIKRVFVQYQVNNAGSPTPATIELLKSTRAEAKWSTGGPHAGFVYLALDTISVNLAAPAGQWEAFWSAADINEVVDNKEALYAIRVTADQNNWAGSNNGDVLYGIRVSYELANIRTP